MGKRRQRQQKIVDAALKLAAGRPWREVKLADIAAEAELSLAHLSQIVAHRGDVVRLYSRAVDARLLKSLADDPVEGAPHDRLFDILMRRLELMQDDRKAIASILADPAAGPLECLSLAGSLLRSQEWVLAAAGLEDRGLAGVVKVNGLALVYLRALRVWASEDDPAMPRTMAALDRALRDGATWLKRLEGPEVLAGALANLIRSLLRGGPATQPAGNATGPTSGPGPTGRAAPEAGA